MFQKAVLVLFVFILMTLNSFADDLTCRDKDGGYAVYNTTREFFLGNGYYNELGYCRTAVHSAREGVVCASNPKGSAIYEMSSGQVLGSSTAYYFDVKICATAVRYQSKGVICVPRESGSGIYDRRSGRLIGDGYYHDIKHCIEASVSATEKETCAPYSRGSAIFDRESNVVSRDRFFPDVNDCAAEI